MYVNVYKYVCKYVKYVHKCKEINICIQMSHM